MLREHIEVVRDVVRVALSQLLMHGAGETQSWMCQSSLAPENGDQRPQHCFIA